MAGEHCRPGEPPGGRATAWVTGFAIVLLSDQPDFVTVQNTDLNKAIITVNAAHESAVVGAFTFTIMAATGSDPATKSVTLNITA